MGRSWIPFFAAALPLGGLALFLGNWKGSCRSFVILSSLGTALSWGPVLYLSFKGKAEKGMVFFGILLALAFRLSLFSAPIDLSEDAARYHWDGKVLAHGIDPYLYPPEARELDGLRGDALDREVSGVSFRTLTVYPPLAELSFALGYLLTPGSLLGVRILWLLAELAAWLLTLRALSRRGLPPARFFLLAFCPLLVFQGYLPGHVDLLSLPFLLLFLEAAERRRAAPAGAFLALACLVKPFAGLLLPAAWAVLPKEERRRFALVYAGVGILFYLPFLGAGWNLFSSMLLMARKWSFNGSAAALLEGVMPMGAAHLLAALLMVFFVLAGAWKGRDFLEKALFAALSFTAFSATLFPWYLAWILPLLLFRPQPALLAFASLVSLSDLVLLDFLAGGAWRQPPWTGVLEYLAFYGILVLGAWRRYRRSHSPSLAART